MFLSVPLANGDDSMHWIVIGLAALTIIYVVMRPALRRKKDPLDKSPFSLSQQRAVERDMSNLLVEMSEMARQITAQLDTRAAKLQALIDEAERKIVELDRLRDSREPSSHDKPAEAPPAALPPINPRYQEIYTLADGGSTAPEIAHRLNRPQGEVELILALRSR